MRSKVWPVSSYLVTCVYFKITVREHDGLALF